MMVGLRTHNSILQRFCLFLLIVVGCTALLSSCCIRKYGCCTYRVECDSCICKCAFARRPQVMVRYPPFIIDYAPDDCGDNQEAVEETPIPPEYLKPLHRVTEPYIISKGDVLEVSIFAEDENGFGEVVVAPDGRVYFMFLDGIEAEGRTCDDLSKEIEKGIASIYTHPSVAVVPKVKAAEYYMILGKVLKPGVYALNTAVNLRSAIGQAGGLDDTNSYRDTTIRVANLGNSFVIRDGKRLAIDFESLIHTGDESQNIYLKPGDYVYIASSLDDQVYILGAVGGTIVPYKDNLTLVGALTPSYGPVNPDPYMRGNWREILIIRGNLDCPCVIRADFLTMLSGDAKDIYLLPGDIIFVPNYQMRFGRALIRLAVDAFIQAFVSSAASWEVDKMFNLIP